MDAGAHRALPVASIRIAWQRPGHGLAGRALGLEMARGSDRCMCRSYKPTRA